MSGQVSEVAGVGLLEIAIPYDVLYKALYTNISNFLNECRASSYDVNRI